MDLISWLNANAGAVQAAATAMLVLITGWYAWKTQELSETSDEQLKLLGKRPSRRFSQRLTKR